MPHWNLWPQTAQDRCPTPDFLSSLTVTDFSWLQKRHVNSLAKLSRCIYQTDPIISIASKHIEPRARFHSVGLETKRRTFLGPWGLRELFLRLPCIRKHDQYQYQYHNQCKTNKLSFSCFLDDVPWWLDRSMYGLWWLGPRWYTERCV